MTGYELDRNYIVTRRCFNKAREYNLSTVSNKLTAYKTNFRKHPKYAQAYDNYIDMTMSCDREEAWTHANHWAFKAIVYGIQSKDTDWVYLFLAAYDLRQHLEKAR